ncbi:MAG: hypothetical protein MUP36_02220 [Demequinaceae bacterium]|nr:hypothetical protein [Demequinaceae bacterium]
MNPISDALHNLVSSDEAAFRAAHSGRGLDLEPRARRARHTRAATRTGLVVASVAVLTVSAFSISAAVRHDSTETDPVAPPVPEGYERLVISLPNDDGWLYVGPGVDPVLEAAGLFGEACNTPLPTLGDGGPFGLEVTSVFPSYSGEPPAEGEWLSTDIEMLASLTYDGRAGGAVRTYEGAWVLIRDDETITQSTGSGISSNSSLQYSYSLGESFSTTMRGWIPLLDCAKYSANDIDWDPWAYPQELMLDPGSYSIIAIAKVEWSASASFLLDSDKLGFDPAWFGEDWRDTAPCRDEIAEAKHTQNGNAIECLPHLYYQQLPYLSGPSAQDYAIVDVPSDFLDGPRKTWYVVSDPYRIELPLEGEPPAT